MKKKNLLLAIILALAAVIVSFVIIQWRSNIETPVISITEPSESPQDSGNRDGNDRLEVSPETVQTLIASLNRPDSYTSSYTITRYYSGGQASEEMTVHHKGGKFRMIRLANNRTENAVVSNGEVHWWIDGAEALVSSSLADSGARVLDELASLVAYEGLLDVPAEDIYAASHETYKGENCIFVKYADSEAYTIELYISVDKRLLVEAEIFEAGTLIYRMQSVSTELTAPADEVFVPPAASA
jgi:hypothetical protein